MPGKGIKVKLKGLTPLQFRNQSLKSAWLKCPIIWGHFMPDFLFMRQGMEAREASLDER